MSDHYIFRLYLSILEKEGYAISHGRSEYVTRMKKDDTTEQFLKSFGILPLTGKLPLFPKNKGIVYKGIAVSVNCFLQGQKGIDMSIVKTSDLSQPSLYVFGDVWGKNYPVEKRMLDHIVHYIRCLEGIECDFRNILIPSDKIVSEKGLTASIDNALISGTEGAFIKASTDLMGISLRYELNVPPLESINKLKDFQDKISKRQKAVKKVKDLIKDTISRRVSACFSPYKGSKRKQAAKIPINKLAEEIKHTNAYGAFNPTVWVQLIGLAPLSDLPAKGVLEEGFVPLDAMHESITKKGIEESFSVNILSEYVKYSTEYLLD
jgi:hypothetical protein